MIGLEPKVRELIENNIEITIGSYGPNVRWSPQLRQECIRKILEFNSAAVQPLVDAALHSTSVIMILTPPEVREIKMKFKALS